MQTNLSTDIKNTPRGREADAILRTCVHCGFCTATCPTYQLLGDELDGPRGRIYLIKQMLEGQPVTEKTRLHLDRCLTCRSCESTCPSGVKYSRLLDIGREMVAEKVPRTGTAYWTRLALKTLLPRRGLFTPAAALGKVFRPLMPSALASKLPDMPARGAWPIPVRARRMIALAGCVQPGLAPDINAATARVLDAAGISLVEADKAGCCGAVRCHLDDAAGGREDARRNIAAWWPLVEAGAEAIVVTASGCGVQVKDYGHLLKDDPEWRDKAERIGALARDVSEVVIAEKARLLPRLAKAGPAGRKLAFHSPCTLQHGMKIRGVVEELLVAAGFELTPVPDSHLCCGSAGTYSVLQPEISGKLLDNKLEALNTGAPEIIATANIGCLTHLQSGSLRPVRHWVELLAERLG
ncbi:MAG: glycolate oxidase subunit GlcF [Rhodocyclaceae bacterium]|nr:glycolate oxidase subunit GlcF [Rhodocyclaceae bacterium]